jgi:hypothetical protein
MIKKDGIYYSPDHNLILRYVGSEDRNMYYELLYDISFNGLWVINESWGLGDYEYTMNLDNKITGRYWHFPYMGEIENFIEITENNVILGDVMFNHYDTIMEKINVIVIPFKLKTKFKMGT